MLGKCTVNRGNEYHKYISHYCRFQPQTLYYCENRHGQVQFIITFQIIDI